MFEQYQDIMTVYDVLEALCIGKNRTYELLESEVLKGFRIWHIWKIPRESLSDYVLRQSKLVSSKNKQIRKKEESANADSFHFKRK